MMSAAAASGSRSLFLILLALLGAVLFLTPVWRLIAPDSSPGVINILTKLVFAGMLVMAVFAMSESRRVLLIASIVAAPAVGLHILTLGTSSDSVLLASQVTGLLFFGLIIGLGLHHLFAVPSVSVDTVAASLCIYLILALFWANVFSVTEMLQPGSFAFSQGGASQAGRFGESGSAAPIYYSLVTISTLGYGDIVPTTSAARLFAASEAVVGQVYLAVLVARLVGLQIANSLAANDE